MNFSKQIKKIRQQLNYTQEQLADMLHVSRQTISSWENNRNLPDIEMLVLIASTFNISLDQLILGDEIMIKKLVNDGSEVKKAKLNIVSSILFLVSIACFLAKAFIGVKVAENGILEEPFFLVILGYAFLFAAIIVLGIKGIIYVVKKFSHR